MSNLYVDVHHAQKLLEQPDVRVIDTRAALGEDGNAREAWLAGHIPGAVHADWIDDWGTTIDGVEGMLPPPDLFARAMERLGVSNDSMVLAYDDNSLFTASRLCWALLHYGHQRVAVIDGGFPAWERARLPIEGGEPPEPTMPGRFEAGPTAGLRLEMSDIRRIVEQGDVTIIDCRMDQTFLASAGRIPGARRLPSPELVGADGQFRPAAEVVELARAAGASPDGPTALYCGGGVSAAAVLVALRNAGFNQLALYDGSWSEWSMHEDNPIERHP